jgi:hypothetical protein
MQARVVGLFVFIRRHDLIKNTCTLLFFIKLYLFTYMLGRYNVTQHTSITFVPNTKFLPRNPSKHSFYVEHFDRLRKRSENLEICLRNKKHYRRRSSELEHSMFDSFTDILSIHCLKVFS